MRVACFSITNSYNFQWQWYKPTSANRTDTEIRVFVLQRLVLGEDTGGGHRASRVGESNRDTFCMV